MKNYKVKYTEEVERQVLLRLPESDKFEVEQKLLATNDPYPILESGRPVDIRRRVWTIDSVEEIKYD